MGTAGAGAARSWRRATAVAAVSTACMVGVLVAGATSPPVSLHHVAPAAVQSFSGTGVAAYGDAPAVGSFAGLTLAAPAVAMASTPSGQGYWVAAADGGVFAFGDAPYLGGLGSVAIRAPVVGMAATPDGKGYWLVAADGGVFAFGDAPYLGGLGGVHIKQPVVGMAATPDGKGYWLVAADGGVFTYGDAGFFGALGTVALAAPIAGMAAIPDGQGYWLVGADGGVFAFGDATFQGSVANQNIGTSVTGIASTPDGQGYWLVAATAAVLPFGDAVSYGPTPNTPPFPPTVAISPTPDGKGYWLLQPDSIATTFTSPDPPPNFAGGAQAVQIAASQIGPDPDTAQGPYCNPYGPCEQWCALFATWVWNQVGINIPRYPFTGSVYAWAAARKLAMSPDATPAPGDAVLYGTGPQNPATSPHMAIVAEVWPDGAITTIDGDSGPEPNGKDAVTFNGPFLPSDSLSYNDMPIYAYVRP